MRPAPAATPFLYAVAPVLALFASNAGQARPAEMLLPAAATLLLAALCLPLFALVFRGLVRGSTALCLGLLLFFSYGHLATLLGSAAVGSVGLASPRLLLPAVTLLWLICAALIHRTRTPPTKLMTVLTVFALAMIASSLYSIGRFYFTHSGSTATVELPPETIAATRTDRRPDIYYIILDRYTSERVLAARYDFDNSPMTAFLRSRGFYVADDSRANYLVTAQSLASSLNMAHITPLAQLAGPASTDWLPAFHLLQENRVAGFLKSLGYRYIHVGPAWNATANNPFADANYEYRSLPEFSMIFLHTTAVFPLLNRRGLARFDIDKYHRVRHQLGLLERLKSQEQQPIFVFAHFLVPHGPYVFNADGSFRNPEEAGRANEHENYLGQLRFINTRVQELVDNLLASYGRDEQPVIVIQGDEGPYPQRTQPHDFDWEKATDEEFNEKMRILNAIYAPGCDGFYPSETPVNTFRIIFNCLFGTGLELLPDHSYSYRDLGHLYDFLDVTSRFTATAP